MIRSRKLDVVAGGLLVTAMALSTILVRTIDHAREGASLQAVLYISSPKLLKRLSLGYEGLLADIYWTRVVQYFGGVHRHGGGDYKLLWPLLKITTELDPHLVPAYEFGGTFLSAKPPDGAGSPELATELVLYGIQNNPRDWHLYYDLAFIYYNLKDYRNSAEAFLRGSQLPGAHPFLKIMAAQMAQKGGDLDTARMMWTVTYRTTHDDMIRANAAAHLRAIQAQEDVIALEQLAKVFQQRAGRFPDTFTEMISAHLLASLPLDPLGHAYRLEHGGKVVVSDPDDLPFLEKGLPEGYVPPHVPRLRPAPAND